MYNSQEVNGLITIIPDHSAMGTAFHPAPKTGRRLMRAASAMNDTPHAGGQAAAAAYIAELTLTLAALARGQDIHTLGYLLDLARLEAETILHKTARH
jgi:hypothetical protein